MIRWLPYLGFAALFSASLLACGSGTPEPTPTPVPEPTATRVPPPTAVPAPTRAVNPLAG